jgi:AcrR family transcriptional regulator
MPSSVRDHIIDVAGTLFYRQGIRAVGIDEIIRQAKVAKATLYRHFASKEEIVVACLRARRARLEARFLDGVYRNVLSPTERLSAAFDVLTGSLRSPDFRGCAFLMAVAEHGESPAIREAARAYKEFIRDQFFAIVRDHARDAEALCEQLAILYEGAISAAVIRPESAPGEHAKQCAQVLFAHYRAGVPAPARAVRDPDGSPEDATAARRMRPAGRGRQTVLP